MAKLTEISDTPDNNLDWYCTNELRWEKRTIDPTGVRGLTIGDMLNTKVLQQKWVVLNLSSSELHTDRHEWRDVPTVTE